MPTLFKRSNGFYYAILSDEHGRRKWISTKERTYRAALKKVIQMGNGQGEQVPPTLLQAFYGEFKQYAEKVYSPETVAVYNRAFTKFIEHCGNRSLSSISAIQEDWFRNVVIVAVLTGMRRGEILSLRWVDIDLERRLIRIQSRENYRTKRGRRRVVPMNPYVYRIISDLAVQPRCENIFTCNGAKIQDRALSVRFKRLIRDLKLDDRLHFHSLRHSFASWLVQNGVSIYDVQKLLGHTNIRVTEIYSHLAPEELHKSVNRIPFEMN